MSRICDRCGKNVIIGQGKWQNIDGKPENMVLAHKDAKFCQKALQRNGAGKQRIVISCNELPTHGSINHANEGIED